MEKYDELLNQVENSDAETMYNNFCKIIETDGRERILKEVAEDMEHFIEDENDDRRLISIGIFEHIPSNTLFKITTRINNDRMNFSVMNCSIESVLRKEKTIIVYE